MNQVTPWDSCTPIQSAATAGNVNWIRLLLELGAEINGPRGEYGSTLHYALRSKDASVVKYVLDNGAEVDDTCPDQSLLCKAVEFGLDDLIPLLLAKGADVAKTENSWTALGTAFTKGKRDSVQLLLDHGAAYVDVGANCLIDTVRYRPLEDVKELLDNGVDPNLQTYQTALEVSWP
jgi:ankyrin repeat protein